MDDLWSTDRRVLAEIVRQMEVEGRDFPDMDSVFEQAEVEPDAGSRSVNRIVNAGMLDGNRGYGGWVIDRVTERGLRETGAWPDPARLAEQIIADLNEAAENEADPERRGRLQRVTSAIAGAGRDIVVDLAAATIARSAGLG